MAENPCSTLSTAGYDSANGGDICDADNFMDHLLPHLGFSPSSHELIELPDRMEKDITKSVDTIGVSIKGIDSIWIDWSRGDERNPVNFSPWRKWAITLTVTIFTGMAAASAPTYAMGYTSMMRDLNASWIDVTWGLSLYSLGFALLPLFLSPLSEDFGRQPLYVCSMVLFALMQLAVALAQNIQSVIVFRFFAGAAGATGSTLACGTVADIWRPLERGLPMALLALSVFVGAGIGSFTSGWVVMDTRLEWRWIQWISLISTLLLGLIMCFTMEETRSSVLLTRLARKMRKDSGDYRYRSRFEYERSNLPSRLAKSSIRSLLFLVTEPVVAFLSLWIGFAWGIFYGILESVTPAFTRLHHFSIGQVGDVMLTLVMGSVLGFICNTLVQERLYARNAKKRGPEARLYSSLFAGFLFPVAMFIYAWTSLPDVSWIGSAIGLTLFIWAAFIIYLAVYSYLADCYGPFTSSAIAGQSLCRNLAGAAFPLFTTQMYDRMTFKWANTVFACIALLMVPIPFILFLWGPQIRRRSKFGSQVPAFVL